MQIEFMLYVGKQGSKESVNRRKEPSFCVNYFYSFCLMHYLFSEIIAESCT